MPTAVILGTESTGTLVVSWTAVRLPPETYQRSALLLDATGRARTSSVQLRSFTIIGGDVITIPIDFSIATFTPN